MSSQPKVNDETIQRVLEAWMEKIPSIDWQELANSDDPNAKELLGYSLIGFISDFLEAGDLVLLWHIVEKEIPNRFKDYKGSNPVTYLDGLLTASRMMLYLAQQKTKKVMP